MIFLSSNLFMATIYFVSSSSVSYLILSLSLISSAWFLSSLYNNVNMIQIPRTYHWFFSYNLLLDFLFTITFMNVSWYVLVIFIEKYLIFVFSYYIHGIQYIQGVIDSSLHILKVNFLILDVTWTAIFIPDWHLGIICKAPRFHLQSMCQ